MNNRNIFDRVYKDKLWGEDSEGTAISGSGSTDPDVVDPYVSKISRFLSHIKPSAIVDLGCGDFNVSKNFAGLTDKYIACDVSKEILDIAKSKFSHLENVEFKLLDITLDPLPKGDVCIVRQVLQHLSNADIQRFIDKLNNKKPYKYVVITEHIPSNTDFKANIDKETDENFRLCLNSGVVVHKEPFNIHASLINDLDRTPQGWGYHQTTVYEI